eukprot:CAMPEP_0179341866 /NCGR_PEP_ID=MMETSP0797-20121207/70084_1 /TAXON_ID=47934 /ORGANISM="Dinophysis acuminata, Strain DAEP01" /LENGTH=133 /DNA_ID=CAMNT_0021056007 /DNA_START=99 /DNA_END=497 /DNA_ORIENTATION=-
MAGGPFRIAPRGCGAGLGNDGGRVVMRKPPPCIWHIAPSAAEDGWFHVATASGDCGGTQLFLNLVVTGQNIMLAPSSAASGQNWKLTPEASGHRLHTMWSGCNHVLTLDASGALALQVKGAEGEQGWDVVDSA